MQYSGNSTKQLTAGSLYPKELIKPPNSLDVMSNKGEQGIQTDFRGPANSDNDNVLFTYAAKI